jgi:hypothetical protein
MAELRQRHLGIPNPNEGSPVSNRLQVAYATTVAEPSRRNP